MRRLAWSYGVLGTLSLAAGLFVLGYFSLSLTALAVTALLVWLLPTSQLRSATKKSERCSDAASLRFVSVCFWLAISSFVIVDLVVSFANSSSFDGFPFDGPFQSFNPLRRMANGEFPLIDFTYFHGNLLPLLLYPFFSLLGKSLFASEMARHLLDLIFFGMAMAILGRGLFTERHYRRLFYVVFLAISLSSVAMTELHNPILSVHSTIVRTFPQIIAFVVAMHIVGQGEVGCRRLLLESALIGLVAAAVFLFTNEQGIYLAVTAAAIFLLVAPARLAIRSTAAVVLVLSFAAALLGIEAFLGWHGPLAALRKIVADQVWYFGSYPNFFIARPSDLWENLGVYRLIGGIARLFIVVSLVGALVWSGLRGRRKEMAGLLALFIYGLCGTASNLGYLGLHYFDPLVRALVVAFLYFVYLAGRYPEYARHIIQRRVFDAAASVLKCGRINSLFAMVGVVALLSAIAKQQAPLGMLTALPHQQKNEDLGVHLPGPDLGKESRWSYWVDEAIANSLFFGRSDAARLTGYGNTVAGAEGPFQNGLVNVVCLELSEVIPQGFGVGDNLRVENARWPLISISADRRRACVGLYSKAQITAASQRLGRPGGPLTGVWFTREAGGGDSGLILSNFNESGAFKINGIYVDRPAVILQTAGKRFGVERRRLPEVGDVLQFHSSGARKVVAVYPNGYVELDRGGLDPYRDGYPRPIRLLESTRSVSVQGPYEARRTFAGGIMLVPHDRVDPNLTGTQVNIPETGQSYVVVGTKPEGMIFLSGFVPPDKMDGTTPRVIWYHGAGGPNGYYKEDENGPRASLGGAKIWSTYTGFPDAMAAQLNPSGTDYIIHALGKDRKQYLEKFREDLPEFFISMHSIPVPTWNGWLLTNHWDLFRVALERYKIAATSLHSIYWVRQKDVSPLRAEPILESAGNGGFELSEAAAGCVGRTHEFFEVDVRYRVLNDLAQLPIVGSSPRAFAYPRGGFASIPISLNPRAHHMSFPALFLCDGRPGAVAFGIEGLGAKFARLEIEHVSLSRIESHHSALGALFGIAEASGKTSFASEDLAPNVKLPH